jgi:hypothetical protein
MRLYQYVGPKRIADRIGPHPTGTPIQSAQDVLAWVRHSHQELSGGQVTATFVVNEAGGLLVADRRTEHVACAGGGPVRSAGELTFAVGRSVRVVNVSNQSTGYCPEPETWPVVAVALERAGLEAPAGFELVCEFRRCLACGGITLVKGGVFECGVCGAELPITYNVQTEDAPEFSEDEATPQDRAGGNEA